VIFGNISIKPGIRLMRLDLPRALLARFKGPRFGRAGVRQLVNVHNRPLMCSALKPMGLSSADLADMAYRFALGGLDLIKDDHGLANQPFSPFQTRVEQCAAAVARANRETGLNCLYLPNITAPADKIAAYARFARDAGAGGLLICPGIVGFDTMRALADDDGVNLPIMSHPSFYGSMVTSPRSGISHYALYGQLQRPAGADMSIYPNFGGRFSFSVDECRSIVAGTPGRDGPPQAVLPRPRRRHDDGESAADERRLRHRGGVSDRRRAAPPQPRPNGQRALLHAPDPAGEAGSGRVDLTPQPFFMWKEGNPAAARRG
jgi:Ribulose 1,5-bisphosphate carboxylase, large subunit